MRSLVLAAALFSSLSLSLSAQVYPPPEPEEAGSSGVRVVPAAQPPAEPAAAPGRSEQTIATDGAPQLRLTTNAATFNYANSNDIKATLGTSDANSSFTVFSSLSSALFVVRGDGNVGIGTATPADKLDLRGDMSLTGVLRMAEERSHRIVATRWKNLDGPSTGYIKLITPIAQSESNMFSIVIEGFQYQGAGDLFEIRCSGYAYAPNYGLVQANCDVSGTELPVEMTTEVRAGNTEPVVVIKIGTPTTYWYFPHVAMSYVGWNAKAPSSFSWTSGETTPAQGVNMNNIVLNDKLGTARIGARLGVGGNPHATHRLYTTGDSDVTTFPGNPVSIGLKSSRPFDAVNNGSGIAFDAIHSSSGATTTIAAVSGVKESTVEGNYAGALTFGTRVTATGAGPIERMRIKSTGEVVIGQPVSTTNPASQKLTINGHITAAGNITATGSITGATVLGAIYQDLAEWVPATTDMAPGTVVVLNVAKGNEVMPSSAPYDTTVAGVVSAQPGIVLGVAGDDKEQIATTGRVKVRVDARNAPIRVGDLLVTSSVSGTAMRSEPMAINGRNFHQPGTIIGKALEPLESGTGEILVLLSMQ
jgi:hypothetical protein